MARTARGRAAVAALSREQVIDEGMAIVAERGLTGLSMRLLAERCDVGTMTLYGFVATKDELVGAIGNRILGLLTLPDPAAPWQQRLRELYGGLRMVLGAHPELAQIFATQHINGDAAYGAAEVAMRAFRDAGLDPTAAVAAFSACSGFVIGFVLQEAAQASGVVTRDQRVAGLARLERDAHPQLHALGARFLDRTRDADFAAGLEFLIAGIGATAEATTVPTAKERPQ